jgi:hypothetical protein
MNLFLTRWFFTLILFFFFSSLQIAQQAVEQQHKSVLEYRIVQYISSSAPDPISIMKLDNNGELILACKQAKTKEQLSNMNINVNDSQIRLLELYDLLKVENGNLQTAFPILNEKQMQQIRKSTKQVAPKLADFLENDVKELISLLRKTGRSKNAYSILFAYIVDGRVWTCFENQNLIHDNTIDKNHPYWAGQVWAFLPEREFSCGTNSSSAEDYMFVVNWSKNAYPTLGLFTKEIRKLDENSFLQFSRKGYVENDSIKNVLIPFGVFNESGKLLLPVIEENSDNEFYQISQRISKKIADKVPALLSLEEFRKKYNFNDIEQSLIIVFHELMWDLMDELVERGVVEKPVLFSNPDKAKSKDVADIVFIVHKQKE